jgi:hypothetical protein
MCIQLNSYTIPLQSTPAHVDCEEYMCIQNKALLKVMLPNLSIVLSSWCSELLVFVWVTHRVGPPGWQCAPVLPPNLSIVLSSWCSELPVFVWVTHRVAVSVPQVGSALHSPGCCFDGSTCRATRRRRTAGHYRPRLDGRGPWLVPCSRAHAVALAAGASPVLRAILV